MPTTRRPAARKVIVLVPSEPVAGRPAWSLRPATVTVKDPSGPDTEPFTVPLKTPAVVGAEIDEDRWWRPVHRRPLPLPTRASP